MSLDHCLSTEEGSVSTLSGSYVLYNVLAVKCNDPDWHRSYKNAYFDTFTELIIIMIAYGVFVANKMLRPAYVESRVRMAQVAGSEIDHKIVNCDHYGGERANLAVQAACLVVSFCSYMVHFSEMALDNSRSYGACAFSVYLAVAALKPFFITSVSFVMSSLRVTLHRTENSLHHDGSINSVIDGCVDLLQYSAYAIMTAVYFPFFAYSLVTIPFFLQWLAVFLVVLMALFIMAAIGAAFGIVSNWTVGIGSVTKDAFAQKQPVHLLFFLISVPISLFFSLYLLHDCRWTYLSEAFFRGFHYSSESGFTWPVKLPLLQQTVMFLSLTSSAMYVLDYLTGSVALLCLPPRAGGAAARLIPESAPASAEYSSSI